MKVEAWLRRLHAVLAALAVIACTQHASAAVRRYAVVIGNDRGDASDVGLRYAETDAQRVYDVLKDLGGFEPADMVLLRGEGAPRAQATLIAINDRIRATIAAGSDALLFVYYSGHGGADALRMSGTRFDLTQLEQLVRGSSATFRVLAVDSCRSGALTRTKGGQAAAPFDIHVDERLSEQGLVVLTSSSVNEDAQESDTLKASFFTHHFVSALLGAADTDLDGRVTLEEAYRYTYDATLRSSSQTLTGIQHPGFRYELRGAGKLPLTELPVPSASRATLVFPAGRTYLVMAGSDRGAVVGEVDAAAKGRKLSVRTGHYFIRGRTADALLEGDLDANGTVDVGDDRLKRIAYTRLVRKGEGPARVAHGPELGYSFKTPLRNADTLCHGAFVGYVLHFEAISVGARLAGCHSSYSNDVVHADVDELGGEIRALHGWDLPIVSIELGLALGGWALRQSFESRGEAPSRSTPAGSLGLLLGLRADLGGGFSFVAEGALLTLLYAQENEAGVASLGPRVAFRQTFGLAKVW